MDSNESGAMMSDTLMEEVNMASIMDEVDASAEMMNGNRSAVERDGLDTIPLDQTFPRLLYELAIRIPTMGQVQAICVWLYEPVRHAIRPHLLMADLPPERRASMAFPMDDSIWAWGWEPQEPLTINTRNQARFPAFSTLLPGNRRKS